MRALCDEFGVVLICDDVRAGWRLDLAGSDHYYGFEADLICFCKALANGYNVSALCGKDSLKEAVSSITYTGSYWMSAVPFAAGIATITKLTQLDAPRLFRELGTTLTEGLVDVAASHGLTLVASGEPALFYLRIADDPSLMLHQRWVAECVRRGVFLTSHHNHFINAALTMPDIARTLDVADEAFRVVLDAGCRNDHPSNSRGSRRLRRSGSRLRDRGHRPSCAEEQGRNRRRDGLAPAAEHGGGRRARIDPGRCDRRASRQPAGARRRAC